MMEIWREFNSLLGPLLVMISGAVVWFAYYHPNSYSRVANWIHNTLYAIYLALIAGSIGYGLGAYYAFDHAENGLPESEFVAFPLGGAMIWFLPAFIIFFVLRFIHRLRDN